MAKRRRSPKVVAPPPPEPAGDAEGLPESIKIRCPVCQTHWANAKIAFGQPVAQEHFAAREDLSAKVKFQKSGLPFCPICNFKYDERALYGLLLAAANELEMERKAWGRKGR